MILNLLSFFVGFVLLLLIAIVLMNHKKGRKLNLFLLVILGIAGIPRFYSGLQAFELIESFSNPFQRNLRFAFFVIVVCYLFFDNLLFIRTPFKKVLLHFLPPTVLSITVSIINPNKAILPVIFLIYFSIYVGLTFILIKDNLYNRKNHKELIHFQSIKKWALTTFGFFFLAYLYANYTLLSHSFEVSNSILIQFYKTTSFIWIFMILYILKNPVILYGEQLLIEKINSSTKEEVAVWRNKKKGNTEEEDLEVEKKVKGKVEELIFAIKKSEKELLEDFQSLPTLKELAFQINYPQSHLKYIFKYYTYCTFGEYQNILKVKNGMKLIQSGYLDTCTIDSLAIKCLYTNRSTFYKNFKKQTGYSPTEYQAAIAAISIKDS
jgi:AraC-like DNA-binding protein